jgi:hypothetical protein
MGVAESRTISRQVAIALAEQAAREGLAGRLAKANLVSQFIRPISDCRHAARSKHCALLLQTLAFSSKYNLGIYVGDRQCGLPEAFAPTILKGDDL